MNSEDKTISKKSGTLTISSQSEPSNPILTYSTISVGWASRNGNVITVQENTGASRTFSFTVTATTIDDAAYDGTATDSKTFNITQEGTATTIGTWYMVNTSTSYGLYGTWTTNGHTGQIAGDLSQLETETQNTSVPLTLTGFTGAILPSVQNVPTVTFTNRRSGASATMSNIEGYGPEYQTWSGSMEVQEGDYIDFTIQGDY